MTTAIFETATLADTVKKAARVAPAKGQAFDKAAGVILDVSADVTVVRATNLEIFFMEWVDSVSVEGDRAIWRLPAGLLASVLGSLPIGSGKNVELRQEGNLLHVSAGRTKARFNLLIRLRWPQESSYSLASLCGLGTYPPQTGQAP